MKVLEVPISLLLATIIAFGTPSFVLASQCSDDFDVIDGGYEDDYRGWYDPSGCGRCNQYCRWVGNSGPGGDPFERVVYGSSWWSCQVGDDNKDEIYPRYEEIGSSFPFLRSACTTRFARPRPSRICDASQFAIHDHGYNDAYRGWYDPLGCGVRNQYCRWVGNSGSGGDPSQNLEHESSWWSCQSSSDNIYPRFENRNSLFEPTFTYTKCSGRNAAS